MENMTDVEPVFQTLAIGIAKQATDANGKITHSLDLVNSDISPFKKFSKKDSITLQNILTFSGDLGPFKLDIFFDTDTYDVNGSIKVFGHSILGVALNAKTLDDLKYNIGIAKGDLFFYIVNNNELWVHLKCDPFVGRTYNKESKLFQF
ncbi:uncharacterized protein N7477_001200 [Penicillium maclennaniae]|uniref:uncharacterized protein n=1 Tax=Penicillium maclennaniae TaxID=1343394 RepID=UPI0025410D46|nr:uncharacterized protein N7477_001200 [Penicillium maclennaniae]KAJ5684855.1 hypothetical protein N7477_001200 [Penicillium maclennaniae]